MSGDKWTQVQRYAYRFLGLYGILYAASFPVDRLPGPFIPIANAYAKGVYQIESWVASHVLGMQESLPFIFHPSGGGDSPTDFVRLLLIVVLAAVGTLAWSLVAPHRDPTWFRPVVKTYLRYYLAVAMLMYGMGKVVPNGQFSFPRLDYLVFRPLGDLSPGDMLGLFMGTSYTYTLFAGIGETVGGLLLLWRRTAAIGGLALIPILLNVLVMNIAYGWDVKVGAAHYLAIAVLLAVPLLKGLGSLLLSPTPGPPIVPDAPLLPRLPVVRRGLKAVLVAWFLWMAVGQIWRSPAKWGDAARTPFFGIWEVEQMSLASTELPLALGESQRWRQVIFERNDRLIVRKVTDSLQSFRTAVDTSLATVSLYGRGDSAVRGSLTYTRSADGRLALNGVVDSSAVRLVLRPVQRSFRLQSCPIQLIVRRYC